MITSLSSFLLFLFTKSTTSVLYTELRSLLSLMFGALSQVTRGLYILLSISFLLSFPVVTVSTKFRNLFCFRPHIRLFGLKIWRSQLFADDCLIENDSFTLSSLQMEQFLEKKKSKHIKPISKLSGRDC